MIQEKALYDASVYTDIQGIKSLSHRYHQDPTQVQLEVSQQFESLLVQMMLKSMRDANKAFASDDTTSEAANMYMDLFDKQLSLVISKSGLGLAKTINDYLKRTQPQAAPTVEPTTEPTTPSTILQESFTPPPLQSRIAPAPSFTSAAEFVSTLWGAAKEAAQLLGVDPKLLLAQAALETNWGKNIITFPQGKTTHNLFNIKADPQWTQSWAPLNAVEYKDGVLTKEPSKFRAYNSFEESFKDYVHFLENNPRYNEALKHAADPKKFTQSLQNAHYATDSSYSDKIMKIYSTLKFNELFKFM